jgi:monoamine oxidase
MAHTAFFDRLLRASRIAAEATERHVPVEQILDEHSRRSLTRRQFVGVGIATAGLAACGDVNGATRLLEPRLAARQSVPRTRVVVVGAGLAGLTCAYRLRQAGIAATVYEASASLGGRCATRRGDFADSQIAEHGGELIDQSHLEIRHLAQELGLPLDNLLQAEANGTDPFYFFDGSRYSFVDATRDLKAIWQTIHSDLSAASYPTLYSSYTPRGWELDHMSLAQWITANVPGGRSSRLGQLLETAYVIEYGADATVQSALNLIYLLGYSGQGQLRIFGHSNEKYHVRGGNDLIVQRLAAALDSSQIVTGSPLVEIVRTNGGAYALTFGTGGSARTVTADHVVLTVPFSVMRSSVNYAAAGFNDVKRLAIAELGMGANAKLNVQFKSRHWVALGNSGETYSDQGYQATWEVSRGQPGRSGILVGYSGGSLTLAQEGRTTNSLTNQFLANIEPVLPGSTAGWNGRSTFDYWPGNPWTKGSYSFWKVGQYTKFAGAEGERSGNCHFAGEHTSIDSQGYLNGAVESGERVSKEILADIKALA